MMPPEKTQKNKQSAIELTGLIFKYQSGFGMPDTSVISNGSDNSSNAMCVLFVNKCHTMAKQMFEQQMSRAIESGVPST
jgi:hypothetical protein